VPTSGIDTKEAAHRDCLSQIRAETTFLFVRHLAGRDVDEMNPLAGHTPQGLVVISKVIRRINRGHRISTTTLLRQATFLRLDAPVESFD
jgi:hypothetical protein